MSWCRWGNSITRHREQDSSRTVDTRVAEDIFANGDPDLLDIAIDNLISNAWKYSSKSDHAIIEFGEENKEGQSYYFIRDNGTGFDMCHADRLFNAFQRLHSSDEFEGTGIGLAIVNRIVSRHGGTIWAEAQANRGAVFRFKLPD